MKTKAKNEDLGAIELIFKCLLNYNILIIKIFNVLSNWPINKEYD